MLLMCQAIAFVSIVAFRLKKQTQLIYMRMEMGIGWMERKEKKGRERNLDK